MALVGAAAIGISSWRRRFRFVPLGPQDGDGVEGRREIELEDHSPSALDGLEAAERDSEVRSAIDALPWEYRELILLRHYGELAYDEIAESKGMPLGTVKNKLFRARQMLKTTLAGASSAPSSGMRNAKPSLESSGMRNANPSLESKN